MCFYFYTIVVIIFDNADLNRLPIDWFASQQLDFGLSLILIVCVYYFIVRNSTENILM